MCEKICKKVSCILYSIMGGVLILLVVVVCMLNTPEIDTKFVAVAYIISLLALVVYALCSAIKGVAISIWKRNDILGLLMCTSIAPVLIIGILGGLFKWSLQVIEVSIIVLLIIFSIIWFGFKLKKHKDSFAELEKNVQIMTTFIALISLALTDISNFFLRVLFLVIGFGYTIMACVLQNISHMSQNQSVKNDVLEMTESSYNKKISKNRKQKVKCVDALRRMEPFFRLIEVIAVVIGSIFIAYRTNQIADIQLKIAEADMQPNFQVVGNLVSNFKGETNANSIVEIENLGGKCSNINISSACFIEYTDFSENILIESRVRLNGFYFANAYTGRTNGLICVLSSEDNWKHYTDFSTEVLNNRVQAFVDLERYIRITYQDQLNQYQIRYYKVDGIDTEMLTEGQGQKIFREYEEENVGLDINNLSLDELKKVIKKANQ